MLDVGVLISGAIIAAVLALAPRWAPTAAFPGGEVLDRLVVPGVVGLIAARIVAAALDDRASLRSVRALLVVRGGVEFWAGAAVVLALVAWGLRRSGEDTWSGLADLAPFVLWGYAAYEATCLLRDGCYGPESPVGLVPDGLRTRMFPVGLVLAAAIVAVGAGVRRLRSPATTRLLLAVGGVAAVRALASFWLPRLGDGLTRQHIESLTVLGAVLAVLGAQVMTSHLAVGRRDRSRRPHLHAIDGPVAPDAGGERA
jgi:hypothetical protein